MHRSWIFLLFLAIPAAHAVEPALTFGEAVLKDPKRTPSTWTGDFNGDGVADHLILVRARGKKAQVPATVKIANPFAYEAAERKIPEDFADKTGYGIVFGNAQGIHLLVDFRSPGIFDTPLWEGPSTQEAVKVIKKTDWKNPDYPSYVPAAAKGDFIVQTTEAADAILYWDGKGFVWKEDPEGY